MSTSPTRVSATASTRTRSRARHGGRRPQLFGRHASRRASRSMASDAAAERRLPGPGAGRRVLGQMKATVRRNYSSPPTHGARMSPACCRDPRCTTNGDRTRRRMRTTHQGHARTSLHTVLSTKPSGPANFDYLLRNAACSATRASRRAGRPLARRACGLPRAFGADVRFGVDHRQCGPRGASHGSRTGLT